MPEHPETVFLLLFIIASTVAIVARRWRIPYTVALVLAGLGLGALHVVPAPHLTQSLLFALFLPGLLFETAFHLELSAFRQNQAAILALAIPGVAVSTALTAATLTPLVGALGLATGFDWRHAVVFGALIAATDPVAVSALFRNLGAPHRLTVLVEGESLLNDGSAIVLFGLVLAIAQGQATSWGAVSVDFVRIVGVGALIGVAIGFAASQVIRRVDDPMVEITLTTVAAYGSFVAAETLHDSGVIATVVAGMFCGNFAARTGMSPSTRVAVETFWEYVAFALNSVVFLLIGFEVRLRALGAAWQMILAAYLAVTLARVAVVWGAASLLRSGAGRIPHAWRAVLSWGGLRGGVAMVLALSIPTAIAHRELLVTTTFGVVILSILVQGLTMDPLLRRLGIVRRDESRAAFELARARAQIANAALGDLEEMRRTHFTDPRLLESLRREYEGRIETVQEEMRQVQGSEERLRDEEVRRARRRLLLAEKQELIDAFYHGRVSAEAYERLLAETDARLLRLDEEGRA
ncbi:MAG: Na+/H+ antiporter [Hyphomicrobiales bacterium]